VDVGGSGSLSTLVGASVDNSVGAKLVLQALCGQLAPLEVGSVIEAWELQILL
jgi:hypothetical protein